MWLGRRCRYLMVQKCRTPLSTGCRRKRGRCIGCLTGLYRPPRSRWAGPHAGPPGMCARGPIQRPYEISDRMGACTHWVTMRPVGLRSSCARVGGSRYRIGAVWTVTVQCSGSGSMVPGSVKSSVVNSARQRLLAARTRLRTRVPCTKGVGDAFPVYHMYGSNHEEVGGVFPNHGIAGAFGTKGKNPRLAAGRGRDWSQIGEFCRYSTV